MNQQNYQILLSLVGPLSASDNRNDYAKDKTHSSVSQPNNLGLISDPRLQLPSNTSNKRFSISTEY